MNKKNDTRQRRWQNRHNEAGICSKCHRKLGASKTVCDWHAGKAAEYFRLKYHVTQVLGKEAFKRVVARMRGAA